LGNTSSREPEIALLISSESHGAHSSRSPTVIKALIPALYKDDVIGNKQ
jgi:hypothetical protein